MKYRKKPVVVEAVQWNGHNINEIREFVGQSLVEYKEEIRTWMKNVVTIRTIAIEIRTLEGTYHASIGDYIIKGVQGEFYPCKPDIFKQTYEAV